jgi:dTDP-4-amino-4,6-dideoxygalactose transaminase
LNAFSVVAQFERRVAEFAGSKYAVAVDCCTNGLFLSLKYQQFIGNDAQFVTCPARTYVSVPMAVKHAGYKLWFDDFTWSGVYPLSPFRIYDGAKRFKRGMYQGGLHCLSFHTKKILNIGRGGMVLTDDEKAVEWLKKARYDGREEKHYGGGEISMLGWHAYMMPDQAARGLYLLDALENLHPDGLPDQTEDYPDLRTMPVFKSCA